MSKKLKLKLVECGKAEERFIRDFIFKILEKKYTIIESDEPDYIFFTPERLGHLKYNCVKIFITGEVMIPDWNVADYGISYECMVYGDRHLRYPCIFWDIKNYELAKNKHLRKDKANIRSKFCSYMVSTPTKDGPRDEFFKKLSEYKKIDSGGKHLNNLGGGYIFDKIAWLNDYKFNICFENSASVGYLTEKLIDAFASGCVPIYWGDPSLAREELVCSDDFIKCKINPKSYINVQKFSSFEEAINEIKRIDNDNDAYLTMLNEPMFLDDIDWYEYHQKKLEEFIFLIFDSNLENAKRLSHTHFIRRYLRNNFNIINVGYIKEKIRSAKKKIKNK